MTPVDVEPSTGKPQLAPLRWAGWFAVAVSLIVLVGWLIDVPGLTSIVPGQIAMKVNTALVFLVYGVGAVILGTSKAERAPRWGYGLFAAGATVSAVIALQYVTGSDFGIDQLLVREPPGAIGTAHLGRMSPQTAIALIAITGATLLAQLPRFAAPAVLLSAGVAMVLGAMNLLDVLYGAETPTFLRQYTQMAVPTAFLITALSVAVVELLPSGGPIARVQSGSGTAAFLRPLLAAAVVVPILVGWLRLEGERRGLYSSAFGVGIMTLSTILLFVLATWIVSGQLNRADRRRETAERLLARALADANDSRADAEAANQAKSEFLSRMSHELRTPLNSVLGFAQLLEMDELTSEQRDNVQYITRGGRHLLDLINEVLDISRIETGTMTISLEPVSLRDVAEEATALIAPLAAEREVTLHPLQLGSDVHVLADRQRLRQVLLNLLSNAVKYNRPRGWIRLECAEAPPNRVRIDVIDTGRGISAENVQRLFTAFDRLGAEQTDVEGTGIGLALSRALVQAMRGSLEVRSELGVGSTFSFELVSAEAPVSALPDPERSASITHADTQPRTVLYIEDNLANLRLVDRILERFPNVRLLSAMQGRLGIDLARQQRPELILLDLHLPDMSGLKVLRELRSDPALASSEIVMLTADETPWRARQLIEEGALAYLSKPLDVPRFLEILELTLGVGQETNAS